MVLAHPPLAPVAVAVRLPVVDLPVLILALAEGLAGVEPVREVALALVHPFPVVCLALLVQMKDSSVPVLVLPLQVETHRALDFGLHVVLVQSIHLEPP